MNEQQNGMMRSLHILSLPMITASFARHARSPLVRLITFSPVRAVYYAAALLSAAAAATMLMLPPP